MFKKVLVTLLLCFSIFGADKVGSIVLGADGKQYKLVKAEQKLPSGEISIAEYVLVGDTSGARYAKHLTINGGNPSFWKIRNP